MMIIFNTGGNGTVLITKDAVHSLKNRKITPGEIDLNIFLILLKLVNK